MTDYFTVYLQKLHQADVVTGGIVLAMLAVMVLYHSLRSPARFFPAPVRSFLQRLAGWPFWTGMVLSYIAMLLVLLLAWPEV